MRLSILITHVDANTFWLLYKTSTYFFRVSSLAYPNLLGKKGYVVVVYINWLAIESDLITLFDIQ